MPARALDQQTYLPTPKNEVADVLSFIAAHEAARGSRSEPRYFLTGPGEGAHVELPTQVYQALLKILQAMDAGKAVTVAPQDQLLTTQQAADLLHVSRPTVIKLIDEGTLHAEIPGTRRRMIKLSDVLECKVNRREAQLRAIVETSDDYLDEDPEEIARELKRIRHEVATRRKERAAAR
ncbi:MAG: helix-turn-helix domain-containing protein [Ruaniaceae bacterium]|nr:helix-turn-helix domain-containing protein [Ruaniaceae bacterium]